MLAVLTIRLPDNYHWLGCIVDVLWLCSYGNKFHIIVHSQNLSSSLGFYVLFGDVFRFIIKEPVRVS